MSTGPNRNCKLRWWAGPAMVVAAAVSLVAGAGSALAFTGAGTGTSTYGYGTPAPTNAIPPCGQFTMMRYDGTFTGTHTFTVQLNNTTPVWYANPTGLYSDSTCTTPLPSIKVSGTCTNAGSISGTYSRVGPNGVFNVSGTCLGSQTTLAINSVLTSCGREAPPRSCSGTDTWAAV